MTLSHCEICGCWLTPDESCLHIPSRKSTTPIVSASTLRVEAQASTRFHHHAPSGQPNADALPGALVFSPFHASEITDV